MMMMIAMMKSKKKVLSILSIIITFSFIFWYFVFQEITPFQYKLVYDEKWTYGDGSCLSERPNRTVYVELLQAWVDLAEKANITYFLTKGTLLSTLRDGELFPWDPDNDIDVLMKYEDMEKLEKYKTKRPVELFKDNKERVIIQEDWKLKPPERSVYTCNGTKVPVYEGLCGFRWLLARMVKGPAYIDIYKYETLGPNYLKDIWNTYSTSSIFPLQNCVFLNVTLKCPVIPFRILNNHYGRSLEPEIECKNKEWVKKSTSLF